MTLAEKYLEIFGQEYNDTDPDLLNIRIKEIRPYQISKAFDRTWFIDCLHDHFNRETVGIMLSQSPTSGMIPIRFEDDLYDTLEEFKVNLCKFNA